MYNYRSGCCARKLHASVAKVMIQNMPSHAQMACLLTVFFKSHWRIACGNMNCAGMLTCIKKVSMTWWLMVAACRHTVDMASHDQVDAVFIEEVFHGKPHALHLLVVADIRVVPRGVKDDHQPGGPSTVKALQVLL